MNPDWPLLDKHASQAEHCLVAVSPSAIRAAGETCANRRRKRRRTSSETLVTDRLKKMKIEGKKPGRLNPYIFQVLF